MNLLKKLQREIDELQLTDKLAIARFLYIRTGELFDYNPSYDIYGYKKSKKIYDKIFDVYDIKDFYFVCASWARLYVTLLNLFGIFAEYIEESDHYHAYVEFSIKGKKFKADITDFYEDITKIKFGFKTSNFYEYTIYHRLLYLNHTKFFESNQSRKISKIDKNINYFKGIYTDEVLVMLKKEIYADYDKDYQLLEKVLNAIMLIMNIERPYVEFYSGYIFIKRLLEYFLDKLKKFIYYTYMYDKESLEFMGVFANRYEDFNQFYIYKKNKKGYYKFQVISKKKIKKLTKNYECDNKEKVLKLVK